MRTEIDRWDPEPVYAQLAGILRGQIERGELVAAAARLPSETGIWLQHYGVSRGTGPPRGGGASRGRAWLRDDRAARHLQRRPQAD